MILKIKNFILAPHTFHNKGALRNSLLFGLFISIFLIAFKPFGNDILKASFTNLLYLFFYGPITSLALILCDIVIPKIAKPLFYKWNRLKEFIYIIWIICIITFFNLTYYNIVFSDLYGVGEFLDFLPYTILIGLLPMLFFSFLNERRRIKDHLGVSIHELLYPTKGQDVESLFLFKISEPIPIRITVGNLLCIHSIGSYSKIYYLENSNLKFTTQKKSLKEFQTELENMTSNIIRCHKSYIANLNNVSNIKGNSKGYKLHFDQLDFLVPVSRSFNLEEFLKTKHQKP